MRAVARWLNKISRGKLHPDAVTLIGLVMHVPVAVLVATGYWVPAAVLLTIFGLFDTLDGDLARLQNRVTDAGGVLDSSTDRMKEVMIYSGAAYAFALGSHPATAAWAAAACGASICVSYVRAKAETIFSSGDKNKSYTDLNKLFRDGLAPFEVRMFLFIVGLLSGQLVVVVALLAVLASIAALQRLMDIRRALIGGKG
jgi:CDP-diacylglycerol--glycerol-3-phosphate 3-phosphatidyltransferase